ncbi:MAG: PPC domain-containing DNA-binding protein [Candidatus Xenobia bacterium]
MKVHQEQDGRLVISIARGEMLREQVEGVAARYGVKSARVWAIGALEDPEIGWWELPPGSTYHKQVFPGVWELLSLDGNITWWNDRPFLHVHTAISGHDFKVLGGHLFDARVGVTVEMFMDPLATPLPRSFCADIGLPRWEPGAPV